MTYDNTLCHKSGKLPVRCFNRLRIQILPIILITSHTYDTEYVVCHRPFSDPPLFSISFVGASYFLGTQLYVGLSGSLDVQTIETPYHLRVTSQTYDTEYVVCHRSFSRPPLFSISFVGASYFLGTQPYVGLLSGEFGCAND